MSQHVPGWIVLCVLQSVCTHLCVCILPVCSDDSLGDSVSDLVENISVVCAADEELILESLDNYRV